MSGRGLDQDPSTSSRHIRDAPDELEDVEALPSLLTFINKDHRDKDRDKDKESAAANTLNANKRGSKRANALLGNVAAAKRAVPTHAYNSQQKQRQQQQLSSRSLVSSSRSLSLPGYHRDSSASHDALRQQQDEVSSTRSIGAVSDSGLKKYHRLAPSQQHLSQSQTQTQTQSRIDKFREISMKAQQKNKKRGSSTQQPQQKGRMSSSSSALQDDTSTTIGNSISSNINPSSKRDISADLHSYADSTFIYSEYSNTSSMAFDQSSHMMSDDDTFMNSANSESNSTFESFRSSVASRRQQDRPEQGVAPAGSSGSGNSSSSGSSSSGSSSSGGGAGSLLSMVRSSCRDHLFSDQQHQSIAAHKNEGETETETTRAGEEQQRSSDSLLNNVSPPRLRASSWSSISPAPSSTAVDTVFSQHTPPVALAHALGAAGRDGDQQMQRSKVSDVIVLNTTSSSPSPPAGAAASTSSVSSTRDIFSPLRTLQSLMRSAPPAHTPASAPLSVESANSLAAPSNCSSTSSSNTNSSSNTSSRGSHFPESEAKAETARVLPSLSPPPPVGQRLSDCPDPTLAPSEEEEGRGNTPVSMCFSLEGRVTSVVTARDGSFVVVGFASGIVKVYELNFGATPSSRGGGVGSGCNTDLEDRYGHQLGSLATSSVAGGSLFRVHLEMSRQHNSKSRRRGGRGDSFSAHVFAGARLGSTRLLVTDLLSLQRLKQKRGFITLAGGGVKTFVHSDIRLRGFSSMVNVSYETLWPSSGSNSSDSGGASGGEENGSSECSEAHGGYRAVYRLLCGGGYGTFTLWRVCLVAQPVAGIVAASPSSGRGGGSGSGGEGEVTFKYSQSWEVLQTGAVNRTMVFGLVLDPLPLAQSAPLSTAFSASSSSITSSCSNSDSQCNFLLHGIETDARIYSSHFRTTEQSTDQAQKGEQVMEQVEHPCLSKGRSLRGVTNVLAASADGLTLFGGVDELIVYRLRWCRVDEKGESVAGQGELLVAQVDTYSLSELVSAWGRGRGNSAVGAGPSRRGGRHLRQMEEVRCTPDGQYAIIRCSDNAVVLYSCLDVFGTGCGPLRSEKRLCDDGGEQEGVSSRTCATGSRGERGVITLWYQMLEVFGLKLDISYVSSTTGSRDSIRSSSSANSDFASSANASSFPSLTSSSSSLKRTPGQVCSQSDQYPESLAPLRPPSEVVLLTSWWPLHSQQKQQGLHEGYGVLKADRLSGFIPAFTEAERRADTAGNVVPVPLGATQRGVGLVPGGGGKGGGGMFDCRSSSSSGRGWNDLQASEGEGTARCWLCKCMCTNVKHLHWPEFPNDDDEDDDEVESASDEEEEEEGKYEEEKEGEGAAAGGGRSKKRGGLGQMHGGEKRSRTSLTADSDVEQQEEEEATDSAEKKSTNKNPSSSVPSTSSGGRKARRKGGKIPSSSSSSSCSPACALVLRTVQTRLASAEAELSAARDQARDSKKQCRILMRKFDRRFAIEKQSRRGWIEEKSRLEASVAGLRRDKVLLEAQLVQMTHNTAEVMSILGGLAGGKGSGGIRGGTNAFTIDASPPALSQEGTGAFCVVCQAHTADTVLLNCGHMCLCNSHALLLQANNQLDACPLCKAPCVQVCRVR